MIVLLVLSIWGTTVTSSPDLIYACSKEEECAEFFELVHFNIVMGYIYAGVCMFLKPLMVAIFCIYCGGMNWFQADKDEEQEWATKK